MTQQPQSRIYETNYSILEKITESLNKDEIGIDDLVEKTREALGAARTCMEILNSQKGEFKKLETEFSQLLKNSPEESQPENPTNPSRGPISSNSSNSSHSSNSSISPVSPVSSIPGIPGMDDPF